MLLTGLPIFSHIAPALLPLAVALRAHGHDVAIASGRSVAAEVRSHGVRFIELPGMGNHADLLADPEIAEVAAIRHPATLVGRPLSDEEADSDFRVMFFGPLARLSMRGCVAAAGSWRPDLMVSESLEYGGYLAAATLGVPHAVLETSPLMPMTHSGMPQWLDALRVACGLDPAEGSGRHGGLFRAGLLPRRWYPAGFDGPSLHLYQPPGKSSAEPVPEAEAVERLVLATMGSVAPELLNGHRRIFDALLTALGEVGCPAVVALGSDKTLREWTGARPANVRLVGFARQRSLLGASSVFVTHAGFSGVRESLLAGVPMLALPLFGDQFPNAARVAQLGAGLVESAPDATAQTLTEALQQLLRQESFRVAAQDLQREAGRLPGFDRLALDLAQLIR